MQSIIVTSSVVVPNCPKFKEGQKVTVSDKLADVLVGRKLAIYDKGKVAVTKVAKIERKAKPEITEKK